MQMLLTMTLWLAPRGKGKLWGPQGRLLGYWASHELIRAVPGPKRIRLKQKQGQSAGKTSAKTPSL